MTIATKGKGVGKIELDSLLSQFFSGLCSPLSAYDANQPQTAPAASGMTYQTLSVSTNT
jgi:hypothetical protein